MAAKKTSPGLSREAIVDAAIDLADADGIAALSMRRLADALGVGAMSLYRHISDKDALLAAMSDEVGQRFPYPLDTSPAWRERIRIAVEVDWQIYRRHPWIVLAYASPRLGLGEMGLACLDWLVAGLLELTDDVEVATEMALTVWVQIQGAALAAVSEELMQTRSDAEDAGGLADLLAGIHRVTPPSHLAALAGRGGESGLTDPLTMLERGVEHLCRGFEARLGR
ncbi:TetR/AcrR family transcriptional regulator [Nocardioides acrostichi]|uniref:TetR/AcrR family transcriptional regulator n=1 Tax=Nocardioides acrostichi TaxID=2784339 RepID=A0A930V3Y5_9ACTN|nr:TetR/AcrR family transcriptional regulator [Nocardioides acrostichi]MBF4163275.1 TetR/AcrR family transcriptional regulator [Nocardioides acrostichi]